MLDSCRVALAAVLGVSGAAAGQMQVWVKQFGTGEFDSAAALAPDGVGGVFLAGGTEGALGGLYIGSVDAWVARRNAAGNVLWTRQLGTDTTDSALALTGDGAGGGKKGGRVAFFRGCRSRTRSTPGYWRSALRAESLIARKGDATHARLAAPRWADTVAQAWRVWPRATSGRGSSHRPRLGRRGRQRRESPSAARRGGQAVVGGTAAGLPIP